MSRFSKSTFKSINFVYSWLTLFSSQLFKPFSRLFMTTILLASSCNSLKSWSNWKYSCLSFDNRELTWLDDDDSYLAMRHKFASSLSSYDEILCWIIIIFLSKVSTSYLGLTFLFPVNSFLFGLINIWKFNLYMSLLLTIVASEIRTIVLIIVFRIVPSLVTFFTSSLEILSKLLDK